ncbi:MAG: glycosyl transferase family 1 [Planctomycetaceae bacterium]|nr:glycosyl transferase family 1 [Planctomycetaceae bacterium]
MKVLLCHTRYLNRGGEDRSFEEERDLLRAAGHEVIEYVRHNEDMAAMSSLRAAAVTVWNRQAAREVAALIDQRTPAVLHATNTFPLISPAACHVAHRRGVAVVQALRNYRLLCAGAYLMRDGRPCEDCVGRALPLPALRHKCYRDSVSATAAVTAMQVTHRVLRTWRRRVDAFFTLTEFARGRFVAGGFPADRVHVKHNCVAPDPGVGPGDGRHVVWAGRLSPEKGVATLLRAWRENSHLPPLEIIGDGPLADDVAAAAAHDERISCLGHVSASEVQSRIGRARALLITSEWYETFGRTIAEAYAAGTPVIASALGAMQELVEPGRTGWQFRAGDPRDLAAAVAAVASQSPEAHEDMRRAARRQYDTRFTPRKNLQRLLEIYRIAQRVAAARTADGQPSPHDPNALAATPTSAAPTSSSSPPTADCLAQ